MYSKPNEGQFSGKAFQKIIDQSHLAVSLLDENFRLRYRSPSAERITGWTREESLDTPLALRVYPGDLKMVVGVLEALSGKPGHTETCLFRMAHKNGQLIWLECVFNNMLHDPEVASIVCNYIDVTARVHAERHLKKTMDELSAYKYALDESAIVAITDQKGILTHVNENFIQISGYSREELLGKDHRIINSGFHDQAFIKTLWKTIAKGKIWRGELKNRTKDGSYYWVDTSIVPFLDEQGKPYQYVAIRSDISERKKKELEIARGHREMTGLLETISDGFIRLDDQLRYTYANRQVGELLKMDPAQLIGKKIWDVFPDAVGSDTYHAIQRAYEKQEFTTNEDYYSPLGLWQENRIYPNAGGLSIFIRDITLRKKEEQHLKLLESVITNTSDAVLITEAKPLDAPGPAIIYVNQAFEKMSGYTREEVIGQSPRFLQGIKTDRAELDVLKTAMRNKTPYENTLINYKKNGESFWNQFSVSPVLNAGGIPTHYIAIERDVTHWKNEELQKDLLSEISHAFASSADTVESLNAVLKQLVRFGEFWCAETWLVSSDNQQLDLVAWYSQETAAAAFYEETSETMLMRKGQGLPGKTWEAGEILYWQNLADHPLFLRAGAAKKYGFRNGYGIPLAVGKECIGVLVLGLHREVSQKEMVSDFFEKYTSLLGLEIKRKQLEQELLQMFNSAPDVICTVSTNRRLKKVNPAMCRLLEYTAGELCNMAIDELVHPDDLSASIQRMKNFIEQDELTLYFENRYLSKSGQVKFMAWTATKEIAKNEVFCVAKDITEKRELERVLSSATNLAKIGGWEIDLRSGDVFWSPTTRRILEVSDSEIPDMVSGLRFCQGGDRDIMRNKMNDIIKNGSSCDCEFEIKTAKDNLKWIRVIAEPEFLNNRCIKISGSFQDIDDLKRAEIMAREAFTEKNNILESIGDAFFAVDRNWEVTYWNQAAARLMGRSKEEILRRSLWQSFPEAVTTASYPSYHEAMEQGRVVHFDDFFPPLQTWYEVSAYPSEKGLSVFFRDITARVNYIKTIEDHNKTLREISWMQSHVVRAPLTRIMGLAGLLKMDEIPPEEKNEWLEYLLNAANELDEVIQKITEKTNFE